MYGYDNLLTDKFLSTHLLYSESQNLHSVYLSFLDLKHPYKLKKPRDQVSYILSELNPNPVSFHFRLKPTQVCRLEFEING